MADRRHEIGAAGEQAAAELLALKGYEILERNVRTRHGEMDIVARTREGVLVFVEVKTRSGPNATTAARESVGPRKQRRLAELAAEYLADRESDADARIDVITVAMDADGRVGRLEHLENVIESE